MVENSIINLLTFLILSSIERSISLGSLSCSLVNSIGELKEVRFKLKLELSDRGQLMEYINLMYLVLVNIIIILVHLNVQLLRIKFS